MNTIISTLVISILVVILGYLIIGGILWVKNRYKFHVYFKVEQNGKKKEYNWGERTGGGLAMSPLSKEELDSILNTTEEQPTSSNHIEQAASLFRNRHQER